MTGPIAPELIEEYMMRLCFGQGCDFLELAVKRAYRDLAPTLRWTQGRGITEGRRCAGAAQLWMTQHLRALGAAPINDMADYDAWHRQTCDALVAWYRDAACVDFTIGQAQKWINTALKYGIILREARVPGFQHLSSYFHLPLDRATMTALCRYNCPRLRTSWSRLTAYDEYLAFQQWIRTTFAEFASPLEVYFLLWQGQAECLLPHG